MGVTGKEDKALKELKKKDPDADLKIRDFMCQKFYDIRTFGAVMTTFVKAALNCGQVRGPVQLGFARSIDPIIPQEVTITRVAITTEEDAAKRVRRWVERVLCRTHCTVPRDTYRQIWQEK